MRVAVKTEERVGRKWIRFDLQNTPSRKTKVWVVWSSKEDFEGAELGQVKFYPQWRKFAFFPASQTLFEKDCLRDIADFCETATKEWRSSRERVNEQR
jgi:hypothetical protein